MNRRKIFKKTFICDYCKYVFKRKDNITLHIKNQHEISEHQKQKCVSCSLCDSYFKNKSRLCRHVKDCHIKTQNNKDEIEDVISNLRILNSQSSSDILAQAIQATKLDFIPLEEKLNKNEDVKCNIKNLNPESQTDILAQAIGTTKLEFIPNIDISKSATISENGLIFFQCSLCSYKTKKMSLLKRHIAVHSSAVRFQCSKCLKKTKYYDNLLKHMKIHDRFDNKKRIGSRKNDKNTDIVINIDKKSKHINVSVCNMEISNMSVDDAILNEMIKDIPCDSLPYNLNDIDDFLFDDELENSTPVSSPKIEPTNTQNKIKIISNEVVSFGTYFNLETIIHDHNYDKSYIENSTNTLKYNKTMDSINEINKGNGIPLNEVKSKVDTSILYGIPTDNNQVVALDDIESILQSQSDYFTTNTDDVYYSNDKITQPDLTEQVVELCIPDYESPLLNCIAMMDSDDVLGDTIGSTVKDNFFNVIQKFDPNQNCSGNHNNLENVNDNLISKSLFSNSSSSTNGVFKISPTPAPLEDKTCERDPLDNTDNVDEFIMQLLSKRTIEMFKEPDIKDFSCDMCRSAFLSKKNLKDHKITVHSGTNFICSICGSTYKSKKSLTRHIVGHSEADRVRCQVCNKSLSRRNLRVHMHKHNDLEPYSCPVCGKTFRTTSSKRCHIKTYHIKPPPKKPRKSKLMDMIFGIDDSESEKRNVSTPQVLLDCANELQQRRPVITAKKRIRGHVCSICKKVFNTNTNLRRHEVVHQRERFVCECGASFINKRAMLSHKLWYHGPGPRRKRKKDNETNDSTVI